MGSSRQRRRIIITIIITGGGLFAVKIYLWKMYAPL